MDTNEHSTPPAAEKPEVPAKNPQDPIRPNEITGSDSWTRWFAAYRRLDLPLFPLHPRSKAPNGTFAPRGFYDATSDPRCWQQWWSVEPDGNVGVRTGWDTHGMRFRVALDVDPRHDGHETLARLIAEDGPLPHTVRARTGSGGDHYYFEASQPIPSRTIGPGLEIKAEGSYVVAPPSIHPDGGAYEWIHQPGEAPIAMLPSWIEDIARRGHESSSVNVTTVQRPGSPAAPSRLREPIPEGSRNTTLASLAGAMRSRGFGQAAIEAALLTENAERCDPPLSEDEARRIARSISRYEPTSSVVGATHHGPTRSIIWDDEIENQPNPTYLVENWILERSLVGVYGPPGAGKSVLLTDLGLRMASGRDFHGLRVKQGLVIYAASEGLGGIGLRVKAWKREHGVEGRAGVGFVVQQVNFLDEGHVEEFIAAIDELPEPPTVVAMDTLAWMMPGGDENSVRDVMRVLDAARRIRDRFGATIIIVHHTGKNGSLERGSSALRAAMDTMIKLEDLDGVRRLSIDKQRDGARPEGLTFRLKPVELADPTPDDDPETFVVSLATSVVLERVAEPAGRVGPELTGSERRLLTTFMDGFIEGEIVARNRLLTHSGMPDTSFDRALKALRERGYVTTGPNRRGYALTPEGRAVASGETPPAPSGADGPFGRPVDGFQRQIGPFASDSPMKPPR